MLLVCNANNKQQNQNEIWIKFGSVPYSHTRLLNNQ